MKHRLLKLVLLLAIGATVSFAVAWGFMLRFDDVGRVPNERFMGEAGDWIADYRRTRVDIYNTTKSTAPGICVESAGSVQPWRNSSIVMRTASRASVGWPMASVAGGYWHVFEYKDADAMARSVHTFAIDALFLGDPDDGWFLPLRPIWPGFAVNTLFYAAVIWLLFVAPFALRRRLRIRRGLCATCAYPRGTSEICTECGANLC